MLQLGSGTFLSLPPSQRWEKMAERGNAGDYRREGSAWEQLERVRAQPYSLIGWYLLPCHCPF